MEMRFSVSDIEELPIRRPEGNKMIGSAKTHSQSEFLRILFGSLEDHGLRYCVLHSYEWLPQHLPSDLDLAIHPHDLTKLPLVICALEKEGYQPVQYLNYAVRARYFVFAWFEGFMLKTAAVDIISEHRRGGVSLASGAELVAGRRRLGGCWVASPATEFVYLLAKIVLKGSISAHQNQRLKLLVHELGRDRAEIIAGRLFGRKWRQPVIDACASASAGSLLKVLGTQAWWITVARNPLKLVQHWFEETARIIRRWFQPTGLLIAVLGPDGAGKTTLLQELAPQIEGAFRRYRCFHWRPGLLWRRRTADAVTDPHGRPPRSLSGSVVRLLASLLDCWVGYCLSVRPLLARSGLVIFDRSFVDLLADPRRYRYGGPAWLARGLCWIRPKPDLILVLDAPEEVILSRKREVALEGVRHQRQAYRLLADQLRAEVIDTALPREQTVAEASRVVTEYLSRRFRRRHLRGIGSADWRPLQTALIRLFGSPGDGSAHAIRHRFAVLPSGNGPRCLLPLTDNRTSLKAIEIYTPYALRARILKGVLEGCIRSGWKGWARDRLMLASAAPFPIEDLVGEVTRERAPVFALSLGTSPRYRKLTVQVMRAGGEMLGYVKLPFTEEAAGRVRHEATVLKQLWEFPALRPYLPQVLHAGEWQNGYLLLQTPVPGRPGPAKFTELHERFLQNLRTVCLFEKPGRALVEELSGRWQRAASLLDDEWQDLGGRALERAGSDLSGTMIHCGLVHGDFAPWNTKVSGTHLFVFDWESASWQDPVLWDKLHFLVQTAGFLCGRRKPAEWTGSASETAVLLLYLLNSAASLVDECLKSQEPDLKRRKKLLKEVLVGR